MPSTAEAASRDRPVGVPRSESVHEWDRWADTYEETGGLFTRINDSMVRQWLRPADKRILDVGCGTGRMARKLATEAREVLGIDTSPRMIELAEREARPNTRFEVRSLFELTGREEFDCVVVAYLLHHLEVEKALDILKALLVTEGILLILDPIRGGALHRLGYLALTHQRYGTAFTLKLLRARFASPAWKRHSREDHLPTFSAFRNRYLELLPGAEVRRVNALFGLLTWRKPR